MNRYLNWQWQQRWALALLCALVGVGMLGGCKSKRREAPLAARFYLEAGATEPGVTVVLPRSGVRVRVVSQPVLTEYDISNVEVVPLDGGRALLFEFNAEAAQALQRLTNQHSGRRLVLVIDGEPLGVRMIDEISESGRLRTVVDRPDSELPALAARLNRSATALQRDVAGKS